ncbi:MAG TPA: glycosyltransferase family 2 protein [Bacteroidia bacterium]|nr:glycosyltransferase family 2 protein [Bacteroidia bacterium]
MTDTSKRIAVVILNWNGRFFLESFLPDVVRFSENEADVIVADNASGDDSVAWLEKNLPSVGIIRLKKNLGYTGGYNEALKAVGHEFYVLLNSDVRVTDGWLKPLLELMDQHPDCAACQPKICSLAHPDEFEYAGAGGGYIDRYGYPFCRGRIFHSLEKDSGQFNDSLEVFWASGACMFIRSAVFHALNGFDNNFFAHMEEIDLCWRIHREGKQVWYCGTSAVYHVGGGTLPKNNPRKTYLNFRNNLLMLYKNLPADLFLKVIIARTIFDSAAAILFLIRNGKADFKAVFEAHRDFHKMKKLYQSARTNTHNTHNQYFNLIYWKSIVLSFYLFRSSKFTDLNKFPMASKKAGML